MVTTTNIKPKEIAQKLLLDKSINNDERLYKVFSLYKENISVDNPELYYAFLKWKDEHIKELRSVIE